MVMRISEQKIGKTKKGLNIKIKRRIKKLS